MRLFDSLCAKNTHPNGDKVKRQNIWQTTNSSCPKNETMEWSFPHHESHKELCNSIELAL